MRRIFKEPMAQATYDTCMAERPTSLATGIGQAFFYGYENPDAKPDSSQCGTAGSLARAAWAAGVDCRRTDDKAK